MEYIKRFNHTQGKKKRTYTSDFSPPSSDSSGHVFRKGLISTVAVCQYAIASNRNTTGRSYRTRAPSLVTAKGLINNHECALAYQVNVP